MRGYTLIVANTVLVAMLAGCAAKPSPHETFFRDADTASAMTTTLDRQFARGAAADATLYPIHFEGTALNFLGRAKLDAIARNSPGGFTVYVDAAGPSASARQEAVEGYLQSLTLATAQYGVQLGADPHSLHPVAGDLARLSRTESGIVGGPAASYQQNDPPPAAAATAPPLGK